MSGSIHGRSVPINTTVFDQADFFQLDGYTRVTGILPNQLTVVVFFNNVLQPWSLVTGVGVGDGQIQAGRIYWSEIPGAAGYYSVRWRPNAAGYWRIVTSYPAGSQIVARDYDVTVADAGDGCGGAGLKVSFVGKGC